MKRVNINPVFHWHSANAVISSLAKSFLIEIIAIAFLGYFYFCVFFFSFFFFSFFFFFYFLSFWEMRDGCFVQFYGVRALWLCHWYQRNKFFKYIEEKALKAIDIMEHQRFHSIPVRFKSGGWKFGNVSNKKIFIITLFVSMSCCTSISPFTNILLCINCVDCRHPFVCGFYFAILFFSG